MLTLICCLAGLAMLWRYLYMTMMVRRWEEVVVLYILASGEHPTKADEYARVWPTYLIMLYAWEWDIAAFIVDQPSAAKIMTYLETASQDSA